MLKITVTARINPTEDDRKVIKAIENVFNGEITLINEDDEYKRVEGFSTRLESLGKLYNLIRIEQIVPAVRSLLYKRLRGNIITFMLHKQAAYVGKISFVDGDNESPLGAIRFSIESNDPKRIIDWLAPGKHTPSDRRNRPLPDEL
ncbi:Protein of unknown function DUF54 [Staphylothermus marinus F1]|uniref:UPF0201 protein Smar_1235 n=1 Tax=Staphylothermus marinus (strain ATCC 43588 / DSM 3639 / JCM 9404 / F1) TaxID=399550 RepID=A3DNW7_STAMF|nr:RNA-binding domain-containing protein [Staphylothermus marinus]ABN70327.1 Protein of unknown function DUF54 [Staphylothermus marinus F1]